MNKLLKNVLLTLLVITLLLPVNAFAPKADANTLHPDIPVLLYHRVVDQATDEWTDTQTNKFRATMKYLKDNGYTPLSSQQYVDLLEGNWVGTAPTKPILLTFDDGTPSFLETALPILEEFGFKSVMFLVPNKIGTTPGYYMSRAQLEYIANHHPSVSIENHTWNHEQYNTSNSGYWTTISKAEALQSLEDTNDYIYNLTGQDARLVAYPYGDFNEAVKEAAAEAGLKYGFKAWGSNGNGNFEMGRNYLKIDATLVEIANAIGGPTPNDTIGKGTNPFAVFEDSFANKNNVTPIEATVTEVQNKLFAGNGDGKAIFVSGRTKDWHSIDIPLTNKNLVEGQNYELRATIYSEDVYGTDEQELQAAVITSSDSYTQNTFKFLPSKQAIELIVPFTYNSGDAKVRIQLNDKKSTGTYASFYVGELVIFGNKPTYQRTAFEETFEHGQGLAVKSGTPTFTVVNKSFEGNPDDKALAITDRKNNWDGVDFAIQNSGMNLTVGQTYTVTANVYIDQVDALTEGFSLAPNANYQIQIIGSEPDGVDDNNNPKIKETYSTINSTVTAMVYGASTLTGSFTVKDTDVKLRISSSDAGKTASFYVGGIKVTYDTTERPPRQPALPFTKETFEHGQVNGWVGRGNVETLSVVSDENYTENGQYALLTTDRELHWNGPALRIEKYLDEGVTYEISAYVKLHEAPQGFTSAPLNLSLDLAGSQWPSLQTKTVTYNDGWVQLKGTYRFDDLSSENVSVYVQTPYNQTEYAETSYYIDDINIVPLDSGPIEVDKSLPQLREVYKDHFLIGNAVNVTAFNGKVSELLEHHHNLITAENAMKPDQLQASKGVYTFETADAIVNAAHAKNIDVHGHVLVWHSQSPDWMYQDEDDNPLPRHEAIANMEDHIETVLTHFGSRVISWDVVNEAMSDTISNPTDWKNALRQSMWYRAIGPDFVELAFRKAREVIDDINAQNGTDIKLYYNDYNEESPNKSVAIYSMVKELNEKYAAETGGKKLIDGIGMQGHYNINTRFALVEAALDRFASLGVEVGITELDITIPGNGSTPPTEQQVTAQNYLYAKLFDLYKRNSQYISRVTFWGLHDELSWRKEQFPLLFNGRLQAKPAFHAVVNPEQYLIDHPIVDKPIKQSTALKGTPTIDGQLDNIWQSTVSIPINTYQQAHNVNTGTAKLLWDNDYLYVLATVNDTELDKTSTANHEQDSIEIFVDELNEKTLPYGPDDGQYRVNFDNETSFNPPSIADGFESATHINGTTYVVEAKIPWKYVSAQHNRVVGFDIQINDAANGARKGVAAWNDSTGQGYNDPSVFGEITLIDPSFVPPSSPGSGQNITPVLSHTIVPVLNLIDGNATGQVTAEQLTMALTGSTVVTIDLSKAVATSYQLTLPASALTQTSHQYQLIFVTPLGTITIPSDALSNSQVNGQIILNISTINLDDVSEHIAAAIGNKPTLSIHFTNANGDVVRFNNPNAPVAISLRYEATASELISPDQLVIWYIDEKGTITPIVNSRYNSSTKTIDFSTTHFSQFAGVFSTSTFVDTAQVTWAEKEIAAMAARHIIKGVSATEFNARANITRADFVALLVRALALEAKASTVTFKDVSPSDYYYDELAIAASHDIVLGDQLGHFNPKQTLTRQDMMVLTLRAIEATNKKLPSAHAIKHFEDEGNVSDYAQLAVNKLIAAGVIKGKDDKIAPKDTLTRAEAAVILYRAWSLQ